MVVDWIYPLTSTNRVTKSGPDTSSKVVVQFWTKLILNYLVSGYLLTKFQSKWTSVAKVRSENLQAQKRWGGVTALNPQAYTNWGAIQRHQRPPTNTSSN